jgi:hypothetical protein
MKITKRQLRRLIREERNRILHEQPVSGEQAEQMQRDQDMHTWPRIEWDSSVGELVDKWAEIEAKDWWADQVEAASMDLENDLTVEIRKVALKVMKDVTNRLINGDYA